jgi:hypothetical protein
VTLAGTFERSLDGENRWQDIETQIVNYADAKEKNFSSREAAVTGRSVPLTGGLIHPENTGGLPGEKDRNTP